ncbi:MULTISPECIES: nucleoside triphosphate pyrophosphohydrolase [unclassified Fusibacter]|uniref:nucleoside triphosphate pyrophosphohydrolase n=1 Tax=unclassified Fusibacter TaxID=2624464 RepID=UPI00101107CA|nr:MULTISPECIES: nucleoside triphosphate pyrophosphohydrolase [unclassified Fusibacter]MCK8059524.1 nucleoside triphosphate pyrophosphohydrolase [Fusibacter sp. A2]NPE21012.1 nucleoside triphosphate pyrophosphohydrolase [Fusibacter sp. A1]RXV62286.1 nucleoside triphosphate pyrophosphohydrolase [Fusibacter sp. A1]
MNKLTIVGLGPGHLNYLTMEAMQVLKESQVVYLRTDKHPVIDSLKEMGVSFESYDYLYETSEEFDEVYQGIKNDILEKLKISDITYAIPGNPFVAEKTVQLLMSEYGADMIRVVHGTSFLDAIITRLGVDPVDGMRIVDCLKLDQAYAANDDAMVCIQCYDAIVASELKIWLSEMYMDDHPVVVLKAVGIPELEEIVHLPLYELDRYQGYDHLTSVVVLKNKATKRASYDDLVRIMKLLRSENGCPWDREQTHVTLTPYVLEEAYEVAEAIVSGDLFALEEELGDLLLQIVFHAQIGRENGDFAMAEVLDGICEKMVSRHPHVFGEITALNSEEVLDNWEAIKKEENKHETVTDTMMKFGKSLPALFRSYKVQHKASKAGFDWKELDPVFKKLHEEIDELKEALKNESSDGIAEETGDLLFTVVNIARKLQVDVELCLHQATDKFIDRFSRVEAEFTSLGRKMENSDLEMLEKAWERAKK